MIRRKQYLYTSASVPRRTEYRRRRRERFLQATAEAVATRRTSPEPHIIEDFGNTSPASGAADSIAAREQTSSCVLPRSDSGVVASTSCESDEDCVMANEPYPCFDGGNSSESSSEEDSETDLNGPSLSEDSEGFNELNSDCEPEEEDHLDPLLKTPLNAMTRTTVGDALLMCLALGLRHSLSWSAMIDILNMINHLFGNEVISSTKYFFLKYMEGIEGKTVTHVYCPNCERLLGTKDSMTETGFKACDCGIQLKDINEASTYFLTLGFGHQVQELLKDKKFVDALDYRFTRQKSNPDAYEDIFDGEVYRSLSGKGQILADRFNLSYTFNTDGFPVGGKSGKQTCWPIFVQFNELPPQMRAKYMILAGIYVGKKDPNMKIFMAPFVEEANILSSVGIDWSFKGKEINSKIVPLCACVDSPARAKLLNMYQFNGFYGCTICHCKAESTEFGLRYTLPLNGLWERTHHEILSNAAQAHANIRAVRNKKKRSVLGVKGLSPIHIMEHLDLVRGVRPDTMHSKLLGNGNHHTSLFIEAVGKSYYIGCDVRQNMINSRLLAIKPPTSIMRPPRTLQHANSWKATEWRSWVLFYGVVCLQGIIPNEYVRHFCMLSSILHIILKKSITKDDLERVHYLILRYVSLYQELFGKKAMVFNVHLLLHTKRDVECLGPAWTNTAFGFEGANRCLLQLKKGTSTIAKEIARKYLTFRSLPVMCEKYASSEEALLFCEKLSGRQLKTFCKIGEATLFGSGHSYTLDAEEFETLQNSEFPAFREVLTYDKMLFKSIRYATNTYNKSNKHDDSFVSLSNGKRGMIHKICSYSDENRSAFLFIRELVTSPEALFHDDYGKDGPIKKVTNEGELLVVKPENISAQCVAMFLDNGNFICDMPFGCYSES